MSWSHLYWLSWLTVGFAVPEMVAVFTGHPERKLSAAVWALEDAVPYPLAWRTVAVITLAVVCWHLFFGPRH
ncbi:MAG TPA: hypothetical protein VGH54_18545 [Mycobacterium sp.]|jgi:hypothetical protein|uniref:hypothetical protein n=1 Tax=Mycobacterium sp. TaxID=1785 RepID=UPI002F423486